MSVWTHVVGVIRIDGLPRLVPLHTIERIYEILGPISTYEHPQDTTIPCGSEGSLQYRVIQYATGFPWVILTVWGDLRSYTNTNEIKLWWESLMRRFSEDRMMISEYVFRIDVDGRAPEILSGSGEGEDT